MRRIGAKEVTVMTETKQEVDTAIQPCARCGWVRFNPDCELCQRTLEECLLMGRGVDGFDL
jgi:recombinational DNA repair protein RecR